MICMAAAGRKKGLSERIGKIFVEIINIFTGSFWTECPEVKKKTGQQKALSAKYNNTFTHYPGHIPLYLQSGSPICCTNG